MGDAAQRLPDIRKRWKDGKEERRSIPQRDAEKD